MNLLRRLAVRIAHWQANILLGVVYLLCWVPVGMLTRILADWLHWRAPAASNWWLREARLNDPAHAKEPF